MKRYLKLDTFFIRFGYSKIKLTFVYYISHLFITRHVTKRFILHACIIASGRNW